MTKLEFSGNLEEIKSEIEQAIATYELLGNRSSINFEQWFDKWEQGFPSALENRPLGNYQLSGEKIWRSDPSTRPRWRQWSSESGVITGEYWRNRDNEVKSYVLSGSAEQLIQHIIQLEYTKKGIVESQDSQLTGGGEVKRKGKPQIHLFFQEDEEDVEPGYRPIESNISIRLMNQTDIGISKAELNQYKTRIESIFASQGGKIWRRGKDYASYSDWNNGYQLQLLVRSKAEAESLMKDFLQIQNIPFLSEHFFYNENQNPAVAFPTNPGESTILGKVIKNSRRRPIANIRFRWASLNMMSLAKPIYLVDLSGFKKIFTD